MVIIAGRANRPVEKISDFQRRLDYITFVSYTDIHIPICIRKKQIVDRNFVDSNVMTERLNRG